MKLRLKSLFVVTATIYLTLSISIGSANEFPLYDGVIEPYMLVDIGSSVEGVVERVNTERSQMVSKGEPLIILESSVEKATVKRAVAQVEVMSEILLEQAKLAFATRSHNRVDGLYKSNAVSIQKNDEAATEVKLASYRLQKARDKKILAEMDMNRAKAILDLRTIRSPISGIVVERFVSPGEFADDQPLLKIAQMDPLRVEVVIPSSMFGRITTGMKAYIKPELDITGEYTATVSIVDKIIDAASNTFGVRLELPNPDYKLPGGLRCTVQFFKEADAGAAAEKKTDKAILGENILEEMSDDLLSQTLIEETKKEFLKRQLESEERSNLSIKKLQEDVSTNLLHSKIETKNNNAVVEKKYGNFQKTASLTSKQKLPYEQKIQHTKLRIVLHPHPLLEKKHLNKKPIHMVSTSHHITIRD